MINRQFITAHILFICRFGSGSGVLDVGGGGGGADDYGSGPIYARVCLRTSVCIRSRMLIFVEFRKRFIVDLYCIVHGMVCTRGTNTFSSLYTIYSEGPSH